MKFAIVYDIIIIIIFLNEGVSPLDYIYLVIAQTGTGAAKFFKMMTKKPFNHVSLASDVMLSEMYSFCRNHHTFPLPATFNKEIVGQGTLGRFDSIPCEIYRIPVTHKQKEIYEDTIKYFIKNRNVFSYNLFGLVAVYLNIAWNRKKNFFCSQFVAYTIEQMGIPLEKPFCLYTPDDFRDFPGSTLIYAGELNSFYNTHSPKMISS